MRALFIGRLAAYKHPRHVVFMESLADRPHDAAANPATMRNNAMAGWVGMQAIFAIGKTVPDLTASSLKPVSEPRLLK